MARNDKANTQLILLVVSAIVATVKFLIEVNKKGLWKEFFISTPIFGGFWYVLHLLYSGQTISLSFFLIALLIAFIVYCIYWSGLFTKSPYQQFSRFEITKNKIMKPCGAVGGLALGGTVFAAGYHHYVVWTYRIFLVIKNQETSRF